MDQDSQAATPKITILVGYHKPGPVIRNGVFTPVRLGAAVRAQAAPSGEQGGDETPTREQEEAFAAMPGDDTGDNISALNRKLCEMTGVYWAWKNYETLGNPDYFGVSHYRRLLFFDDQDTRKRIRVDSLEQVDPASFSEETIRAMMSRYDMCIPAPVALALTDKDGARTYCTIRDQYAAVHYQKDLDLAFATAVSMYPDYADSAREYALSYAIFPFNMFVMRKDLFFHYAKWIFNILFAVSSKIVYQEYSEYQKRALSFLAERLTGLFIWRMRKKKELRVAVLPSVCIRC